MSTPKPVKTTSASAAKASKLLTLVSSRLRVTLVDRRVLVGTFLAFDGHMNMVLSSCEEQRTTEAREEGGLVRESTMRRALGLVILRGENVVSVTVEGQAPVEKRQKAAGQTRGVVQG
eukprot:CAMPEP_0182455448 /NCGR_PEP_ID=MMETSP1319-20130603/1609_1 /TAXON_ID=172717 /ORGANISM="Bolidomonas pacifica, Strain RCC208" /LENGTH=117 /DNA_ID=CAMNT_0024653505 /DNA_START=196 /DNA_END=545 /DNA_ORIENTATION=-